ncbi:5600_t:CDS:2 [Acaulospora colombiana]|uniref:5600_t:CDS:1 n=1 Tax=Acaulospora colombiana TaxID=27376 RepID=A0ACA9LAV7_9GLOM|nr:5600_t:CDS:2 [Acaulospora colombiana]
MAAPMVNKKIFNIDKKSSNSKKSKTIHASPTAQQMSTSTNNNPGRDKQADKDPALNNLEPKQANKTWIKQQN